MTSNVTQEVVKVDDPLKPSNGDPNIWESGKILFCPMKVSNDHTESSVTLVQEYS